MVRAVRDVISTLVRTRILLALGGASAVREGVRARCEHRKRHAPPLASEQVIREVVRTLGGDAPLGPGAARFEPRELDSPEGGKEGGRTFFERPLPRRAVMRAAVRLGVA